MEALRDALPRSRFWLTAVGVLIAVFLIAPLLAILPLAFTESTFLVFPPTGFSWVWFDTLISDPGWRGSILNSGRVATAAAILATIAGTSAALAVRRLSRG
ncbi:MAG: hypothetical protein ACRDO7_06845, partial [Nocardioidaceae bacterium]